MVTDHSIVVSNLHLDLDQVAPVIGIAFSLITVRVHNAFNPDMYNTSEYRMDNVERGERKGQKEKDRHRAAMAHAPDSSNNDIGPLSDPLSYPLPLTFESISSDPAEV